MKLISFLLLIVHNKILSQNLTSLVLTLGKCEYFLIKVIVKVLKYLDDNTLFFKKFLYIFSLYQVDFKKKFVCYENQIKRVILNF